MFLVAESAVIRKNCGSVAVEMCAPRFILTHKPVVPRSCFIHPSAVVAGNVVFGEDVSIWPNAVLRGDSELIQLYVTSET